MPRKRHPSEITTLGEPELTETQWRDFRRGVELFNAAEYWHAHEAWERVWLEMPDDAWGDSEIVLRGLVQMAAALHLRTLGRSGENNFRKALEKLSLAPPAFLGIDFAGVVGFVRRQLERGDSDDAFVLRLLE